MKTYNKVRLKALIIDIVFITIIWMIVMLIYAYLTQGGTKYDRNVWTALLFSLLLCKDNITGQSIGKRICKLKAVDDKGRELNSIKLIGRNWFILFAPIEFILLLYYDKRLGDKVMQTKVVLVEKPDKITFKNVLIYLFTLFVTFVFCLPLGGISPP